MISKKAKSLLSIMFAGLIIAFIVQIAEINTTEAQNVTPVGGPPVGGLPIDVPSGGKNIIKGKPSSTDIPLHQDELKNIDDQLLQNPSEAVRNQLIGQKKQIYDDVEKWFADNVDPIKENAVREKQELLTSSIIAERFDETSKIEQEKTFPVVAIGYDCVSNALEVAIYTPMFNNKNIERYITKIRNIIGNEIDLTLVPQEYSIPSSCFSRAASPCTPLEGGVEVGVTLGGFVYSCTTGFKATYKGEPGFITAGHCYDFIGQDVHQPKEGSIIGSVKKETLYDGTHCDGAFVKSSIPMDDGAVFGLPDLKSAGTTLFGRAIIMSGKTSGLRSGFITDISRDVFYPGDEGLGWILDLAVGTYFSANGDSGAPIALEYGTKLMGFHQGTNGAPIISPDLRGYYTKIDNFATEGFIDLTWGFSLN